MYQAITKKDSQKEDFQHITEELYKKNLELARLNKEVKEANEKLKQLDHLKDEFISIASHELRTPMTIIKTYLWMVMSEKGGPITEKQKFYLDRAYSSTDHLITFVNDMLNVSRIESNRITLTLQSIELGKYMADSIQEFKVKADEQKIELQIRDSKQPLYVQADPDKLREVITNIIGNALKFTPPGGSITISFTEDEKFIKTSITDTGAGIVEKDIPKLFQKFSVVGNDYLRKQNAQGTGLGLYITKSIIKLHGGKIEAISKGAGKGTTFTFSLKRDTQPHTETKK